MLINDRYTYNCALDTQLPSGECVTEVRKLSGENLKTKVKLNKILLIYCPYIWQFYAMPLLKYHSSPGQIFLTASFLTYTILVVTEQILDE